MLNFDSLHDVTLHKIDYALLGSCDMNLRDLKFTFEIIVKPCCSVCDLKYDYRKRCLEKIINKHFGHCTLYAYLVNRTFVNLSSFSIDVYNNFPYLDIELAHEIIDRIQDLENKLVTIFWT